MARKVNSRLHHLPPGSSTGCRIVKVVSFRQLKEREVRVGFLRLFRNPSLVVDISPTPRIYTVWRPLIMKKHLYSHWLRIAWVTVAIWIMAYPAVAADRTVFKIGGDVTVEAGTRVSNVVVIVGQATIHGTVDQHVLAVFGSVVLTRTALILGDVLSIGGVVVTGSGAEVQGDLTEINASNLTSALSAALSDTWDGWSWVFAIMSLAIFLCLLVLAILLVALFPRPLTAVAGAVRETTFKATLWGIVALALAAPLAVLLAISIVGIVLIPLEMTVIVGAAIMGFIAVGQLIGRGIFRLLKREGIGPMRETIWGLVVLWLLGWIPYFGWTIKALAIVLGLGAALITRFGFRPVR